MTITRTFGTGLSDYATFTDIYNAHVSAGTLTGDEVWNNEGSHTIASSPAGNIQLGGYTLTINFGLSSSYLVTMDAKVEINILAMSGTITVNDGEFRDNGIGGSVVALTVQIKQNIASTTVLPTVNVQDVIVGALDSVTPSQTGLLLSADISAPSGGIPAKNFRAYNCVATGFDRCFYATVLNIPGGESGLVIEQCDAFNSIASGASDYGMQVLGPWAVTNCFSGRDNADTSDDYKESAYGGAFDPTWSNCADTDGTAFGSNTQSNVTPSSEFKSTTYGNAEFLHLKNSAPQLGKNGTTTTLGNEGLGGNPRPTIDGEYSIGAYQIESEHYITFKSGSNVAYVRQPNFGYKSDIRLAMTYSRRHNGSYGIFDHGFNYDVRICRDVVFDCTESQMDALSDLFRDSDKGRGDNVTLSLGTDSGFYPFGPDFGDSGDFVVRVINFVPGGQTQSPWKYYRPRMDILYVSGPSPSYSFSDTLDDGEVQLGSITGLKWPQGGYAANPVYDVTNTVTNDGTAHEVDAGSYGDVYQNAPEWQGNQGKMASLVNHLVSIVRDSNLSLVTPSDHYAFGRDQAESGEMLVQPLYTEMAGDTTVLSVVHDRFDHFSAPIALRFVS